MHSIVSFLVCISLAIMENIIKAEDCQCGIENKEKVMSRIIGGREVNTMKYPWMAAIFVYEKDYWAHECGGSIINNKVILTAAHCLYNIEPSNIEVLIGSFYLYTQERLKVKKYTIHQNFNGTTKENDIALLFLTEQIEFNENQRPICLPSENMEESVKYRVAGWGKTETGAKSHILRYVTIENYSLSKCRKSWRNRKEQVTERNICAGNIGRDTCKGDSGGPLMQKENGRYYVVGITSFGEVDCGTSRNSVYIKVSSYIKWIHERTEDFEYCDNKE